MKIIFVVNAPFYERDYSRFGIEYLMQKKYSVEIWSLIPKEMITFHATAKLYTRDNYYEYELLEFEKQLQDHIDDMFVIIQSSNISCIQMYNRIISNECRYILINGLNGVFLLDYKSRGEPVSFSANIIRKIRTIIRLGMVQSAKTIYEMIFRRICMQIFKNAQRKNPPMRIITSTHNAASKYLTDEELQGNVLYTHAMDYDRYIEENRKSDEDTEKYIVFCDNGLATIDYDSVLENYAQLDDKKRYSRQIEEVLSKMEEKYNLPVVVLGHPHTKYESDIIFGHKIIMDKTAEFARKAAFFILNTSTAINFAVLYDIPTLQVVNKECRKLKYFYPNLYEHTEYEAKNLLGCGFLDMDDEEAMKHPWDYVKRMDTMKREQYMHDYLIDNDTTDKCSYEYLEEVIRPYFSEEPL